MTNEQPPKNGMDAWSGLSPEISGQLPKARNLLELLINSGGVITIAKPTATPTITIKHERDVAADTDSYVHKVEKSEPEVLGWILPFDENGFIVIDQEFTTSIHFVNPHYLSQFKETFGDDFQIGRNLPFSQYINDNIHSGGILFDYEDKSLRLDPLNPEHTDQINKVLNKALTQSIDRLRASFEAQKTNQGNTISTMADFLDKLSNPPSTTPPVT